MAQKPSGGKSTTLLRTLSMQAGEQRNLQPKKPAKSNKMEYLTLQQDISAKSQSFLKGIFSDDPIHNPPLPYSACGSGLFLNNFSRERAIAKMEREAKIKKMSEISLALRNQGITQQIARFKERELDIRLSELRQQEVMEEFERNRRLMLQGKKAETRPKRDHSEQLEGIKKEEYLRLMRMQKEKKRSVNLSYNIKYAGVETRSRVCTFKGKGHCFDDMLKPLDDKLRPSQTRLNFFVYPNRQAHVNFGKMLGRSASHQIRSSSLKSESTSRGNSRTKHRLTSSTCVSQDPGTRKNSQILPTGAIKIVTSLD